MELKISDPFSSTKFTIRTSTTGQTIVHQELLHRLVIQDELEKMCIPDREEECFTTRRSRQVEFKTSSRLKHDVKSELFHKAVRTGFCWTMLRSSKCFLANCFQMPLSEEIPKVLLLQMVHLSMSFFVHRQLDSSLLFLCQPELLTPIRRCSANTELIDRMNCSEQEFCVCRISIGVYVISTLLQDSATQSTNASEHRVIGFFESLYHFVGHGPFSFRE